ERDALAVSEAPSTEDGRAGIDPGGELFHEPRLACTGRPQDREEMTGAVRRRAIERLTEQRQLALTAHHRCVQSSGVTGGTGRDVLEEVRGHRLYLPFGFDRIRGLRPDRVARQPVRLFTDQDLTGRCRLL